MLALVGLSTAGAANAAEPRLPLGTDGNGVTLRVRQGGPPHRHRELVLRFDDSAAPLFRQIADRRFVLTCVGFDRHPAFFEIQVSSTTELRAPRRRRAIPTGMGGGLDLCGIGLRHGRRTTVLTRIPLTPLGAVRLDERITAERVAAAVRLLARAERPSAEMVAARLGGVVLASPTEAPPPGALGVYSDGVAHVYAAQTDRGGKLHFLEHEGDVTRTNVVDLLIDSLQLP